MTRTSRLTVFAFLWACQALVHHEFYSRWLQLNDWAGWLVAVLATAVLLRPQSLPLFAGMLAASVVYNVRKWPFVVNHIFMESFINVTILAIMGWSLAKNDAGSRRFDYEARERLFDRFAPVLRGMVIVMYYFAFIAKLNHDFFNPQVSCVAVMYKDLLRRVSFMSNSDWAKEFAIWGTIVVEASIPVLFTFRRTRLWAVAIGLPFHLMLGTIGHRTFSALAFALYGLFLIDWLAPMVDEARASLVRRFGQTRLDRGRAVSGAAAALGIAGLIAAAKSGHYQTGAGPFAVYRVAWSVWGLWSLGLMAAYFVAISRSLRASRRGLSGAGAPPVNWFNVMTLLVFLNGMAQYVGLKTETSFTMYSNLRTEAGLPNHLFLRPAHLTSYQEDLVQVLDTDRPELQRYVHRGEWMTFFEFRRFTSTTPGDFWIRYRRNDGEPRLFTKRDGVGDDPELTQKSSWIAAKLLYFRPVSEEACMPCLH